MAAVAAGRSEVQPGRSDRRFSDPTWTEMPLYRRLMQGYLAASSEVQHLIDDVPVDERERARAQLAQHLQLSAGPLPVSDHTQELEQEHPILCVVGGLANLGLKLGQSANFGTIREILLDPTAVNLLHDLPGAVSTRVQVGVSVTCALGLTYT